MVRSVISEQPVRCRLVVLRGGEQSRTYVDAQSAPRTRPRRQRSPNHLPFRRAKPAPPPERKRRSQRLFQLYASRLRRYREPLADFVDPIGEAFRDAAPTGEALAEWKYQRYMQDYLGSVLALDEGIGRLLDYLDENGLTENTLVVYTSDQGFYLGEHGWYDKRFMYEESLRTPLVMRLPTTIAPGQVNDALVLNLD